MNAGSFVIIAGICTACLIGLSQRDDDIRFHPRDRNQLLITRSHPLKQNKFLVAQWEWDKTAAQEGWCIFAADPGEAPRFHLVLDAAGESLRPTRPEWWKR